jgi:lipopolysaccharide transport system ATP-binding protein
MSTVITVDNLGKAYRLGLKETQHDTLMGAVTHLVTSPVRNFRRLRRLDTRGVAGARSEAPVSGEPPSSSGSTAPSDLIWALSGVSFEVTEGEVVGIIGRNGAGKSTLLKILSRITEPTTGRAVIRGRVGSLLEVGTGFHPELTGRENVYMNGTILGMSKREIDKKFDEIVEFSGVEKFLDTPIKHYSSGMQVRLAFAVAAHLDPEILVIDEVLAVGDSEFQKKCLGKMQDVARCGRTIFFVSHNMAAVSRLCTSALLLREGTIALTGAPDDVIRRYLADVGEASRSSRWCHRSAAEAESGFHIRSAAIKDSNGFDVTELVPDQTYSMEIAYEISEPLPPLRVGFWITSSDGYVLLSAYDVDRDGGEPRKRPVGNYVSRCQFRGSLFNSGTYSLTLHAGSPGFKTLATVEGALRFHVHRVRASNSGKRRGPLCVEFPWEVLAT